MYGIWKTVFLGGRFFILHYDARPPLVNNKIGLNAQHSPNTFYFH